MNDKLASAVLADVTRNDIITKYSEMEAFFGEISNKLAAIQPYQDTGFNIDEVLEKFTAFKQTIHQLFTAPPPKAEAPKTVIPEHEEAIKANGEKPDVDMKAED